MNFPFKYKITFALIGCSKKNETFNCTKKRLSIKYILQTDSMFFSMCFL